MVKKKIIYKILGIILFIEIEYFGSRYSEVCAQESHEKQYL